MIFRKLFLLLLVLDNLRRGRVRSISCDYAQRILDGHNYRRMLLLQGKVPGQPAASNMTCLRWDMELAKKAQKWADVGALHHNPVRTIDSRRFKTGENIFILTTTRRKFNVTKALENWFQEYKHFTFAPLYNRHFFRPEKTQIGHYTQMIWANTTLIGCGLSTHKEGRWTNYVLVCNYGPAGNVLGETPYKTGGPKSLQTECPPSAGYFQKLNGSEC